MTTEAVCELNDFHSNSPSSFGYFNRFSIRPSTSLEEVQICMPCNTEDRFVARMSPTFHQSRKQKKSRRGTANGRIRENYCSLFRLQTAEEDFESLSASSTESLNSLTNFPLRANSRSDDKFRRAVSEQSPNPDSICDLLLASTVSSSPNQNERQKSDPVDILMTTARTSKNIEIHHSVEPVLFEVPEISVSETNDATDLDFDVCSSLQKLEQSSFSYSHETRRENRRVSAPCRLPGELKGLLKLETERSKSPLRKAVTFADNQGLCLHHVLSFEKFQDLDFSIESSTEDLRYLPPAKAGPKTFAPLFFLPPCDLELPSKLQKQKVKLESVNVVGLVVIGTVAVLNLSYAKEVTLRYTINGWESYTDLQLQHVPSKESFDRFSFEINFSSMNIDNRVVFCIRFSCDAGEFWDSNNGFNYTLKLLDC